MGVKSCLKGTDQIWQEIQDAEQTPYRKKSRKSTKTQQKQIPKVKHKEDTLIAINFNLGLTLNLDFPGGSVVKNPPTNAGETGDKGFIPE